jgi:hypothetical protein
VRRFAHLLAFLCFFALAAPATVEGRPGAGSDAAFTALQRRVEEIRGLRFKGPVQREALSPEAMRAEVRRQLAQEYDPEEWAPVEGALRAFRLIPADADLRRIVESVLEQQAAGLYDPRSKKLFVLSGGSGASPLGEGLEDILGEAGLGMGDIPLVHELAHALADQHFDLLSLPIEERFDQDRSGAAMAVIEGDATWVMMEFTFGALGMGGEGGIQLDGLSEAMRGSGMSLGEGVPRYVQENLLGAYLDGLTFVKRVREKGGVAAQDALFRKPPQSMEQVMHPEKYLAGEVPQRFQVHPPPHWTASGWRESAAGIWGELNTKIILQEWGVPDETAVRASEGWGGDAYVTASGPSGDVGWVWVTRWDSEKDAKEFRDAFASRPGVRVTLDGRQVTVVSGGPAAKTIGPKR